MPRTERAVSTVSAPQTAHVTPSAPSAAGAVTDALLRAARGLRWYVTSMMGDGAYAAYLAHHRAAHGGVGRPPAGDGSDDGCATPPLSERAFWAERHREQDANPGSRCC